MDGMVRILLNGINGQMGRAMRNTLSQFCDQAEIVCGVDCNTKDCGVPVYSSAKDIATEFDVAVDFSVPQATMEILTYCPLKTRNVSWKRTARSIINRL